MFRDKKLKESFDNIVDVISCVDGGKNFMNLKLVLEDLEREMDAGKPGSIAAKKILNSMLVFSRLADFSKNVKPEKE